MPQTPTNPRKTPRQGRSRVTYDAILESAAHILVRRGAQALNTNLIAERAGVSIGSLYQYFPTKEAILAELLRRQQQDMLDDLKDGAAAAAGSSLAQTVRTMIHHSLRHHIRAPLLAERLEQLEPILIPAEETLPRKENIAAIVVGVLRHHNIPNPELAAKDLSAMTAGMAQAEVRAGGTDFDALTNRIAMAANGYLNAVLCE